MQIFNAYYTHTHTTRACIHTCIRYSNKIFLDSFLFYFLLDDQDMALGGLSPMTQLKELVIDEGTLFVNAFVTTPICCPSRCVTFFAMTWHLFDGLPIHLLLIYVVVFSRSSILTGKYVHNHGAHNNSVNGNCAGQDWVDNNEKSTVATSLHELGYRTMFAGKYLNQYGLPNSPSPVEHVPPGWDSWLGLCGNSQYYNYHTSDNGVLVAHGSDYASDYFTDVIANRSYAFLENTTRDYPNSPFFMMLATPASHGPNTAAPQYDDEFPNATAPRTPNYNVWGANKHWLMRYQVPMDSAEQRGTDITLQKRWRTLLSVDDMISNLVRMLDDRGILDDT